MLGTFGTRLIMTRGDFGAPLSIHLQAHCAACAEELYPTDAFEVRIEHGGEAFVTRRTTWKAVQAEDGYYTLLLTEAEAKLLDVGLYTWRVILIRDGELRDTLVTDTLEVVQ